MSEDKLFKARGACAVPFHMVPVDIIIPFHGEHSKVSRLLESIFKTVRTNRYQVNLVDDCSPNKEFIKQFKKIPGVVTFRHENHKGFGAAVNTALAATKQPYVVVMHSDVVVEGNTWLAKMGETLMRMKSGGVKMVGARTANPEFLSQGDNDRLLSEDEYLPFHCVLCSRELFKRVGPLKEYPYAGGEAEEFGARMKSQGYKQAVSGSSWVEHEGAGTLADFQKNKKVQDILRKAREQADADIKSLSKTPVMA